MAKVPMTNQQKLKQIMNFSNYGPLAEIFVMEAVTKWSEIVAAEPAEKLETPFMSGEAWKGVAAEISQKMKTQMFTFEKESA